jgi:hypothetical protein
MRVRLSGELWWILNLAVNRADGVLMSLLRCMGCGLWKNIRRGFQFMLDLRCELAPRLILE